MLRRYVLCVSLALISLLIPVHRTFASTMTIPVVSGTISFSPGTLGFPVLPNFNLVTTLGSITGFTTAQTSLNNMSPAPYTADPSLTFFPGDFFRGGGTSLTLQVFGSNVLISSDGLCCDQVSGFITAPSLGASPGTYTVNEGFYFYLDLVKMSPAGEYILGGSGTASIQFTDGHFRGATYSFVPSPEPSTGVFCVIALLAVGLLTAVRRRVIARLTEGAGFRIAASSER